MSIEKRLQAEQERAMEAITHLADYKKKEEILEIVEHSYKKLNNLASADDIEQITINFHEFIKKISGWWLWIRLTVKE